jgi:hypothetical protein
MTWLPQLNFDASVIKVTVNTKVDSGGNHDLPIYPSVKQRQKRDNSWMDLLPIFILIVEFQPATEFRSLYNETKCAFPSGIARQVD